MSKRRKFSEEFKREAVGLTQQPGAIIRRVARDIGVGAGLLGRWRRELESGPVNAFFRIGRAARSGDGNTQARACAREEGTGFFARCGGVLRQGIELRYQTIQRCRSIYPVQLMCRCLKVSNSGLHAWSQRLPSLRARDNQRLLSRIRHHHAASEGVMGMPRMHEQLRYEGETASANRVARLMARDGLFGVPQRRAWRRKRSGIRPTHVRNPLERDFAALEPNTKWVTDITYVYTAEGWLYLWIVLDLFNHKIVGWSMSGIQDRHLVLSAVLMACWQRPDRNPVLLHPDRGTQFTSSDYHASWPITTSPAA